MRLLKPGQSLALSQEGVAQIIIKDCQTENISASIEIEIPRVGLTIIKLCSSQDNKPIFRYLFRIPSRSDFSISRPEILGKIDSAFQVGHLAFCHGLSGSGKKFLAAEHVYQNLSRYQNIFWFSAKSMEKLEKTYRTLAENLALIQKEESVDFIQLLKEFFSSLPACLIVFTDAPDYESIQKYLPEVNVRILVTSPKAKRAVSANVKVDFFREDQSELFIRYHLKNIDEVQLKKLTEISGGQPFFLFSACQQMNEEHLSVDEYCQLYEQEPKRVLEFLVKGVSLFNLWGREIKAIRQISALAYDLLRRQSGIDLEVSDDEVQVKEALGLLKLYSFIQMNLQTGSVWMHPHLSKIIFLREFEPTWEILETSDEDEEPSSDRAGLSEDLKIQVSHCQAQAIHAKVLLKAEGVELKLVGEQLRIWKGRENSEKKSSHKETNFLQLK